MVLIKLTTTKNVEPNSGGFGSTFFVLRHIKRHHDCLLTVMTIIKIVSNLARVK